MLKGELLDRRGGGRFTRCLANDIDAWYGAERIGRATAAHEDKEALNDPVDELELEVELVLDPDWSLRIVPVGSNGEVDEPRACEATHGKKLDDRSERMV